MEQAKDIPMEESNNKDLAGLNVKCPVCTRVYLQTTDQYDPDIKAHGAMVTLKDPWKKWKWSPFGDGLNEKQACKESRSHFSMFCTGCGAGLCRSGKLRVMERPIEPSHITVTYTDEELEREWNERIVNAKNRAIPHEKKVYSIMVDDEEQTESRDDKIFRLKKRGMTNAAIGKKVGLSGAMVGVILKKGEKYEYRPNRK
uniref:Uncharacterized protein n=1 Tax=viral metagenome TaxID=1070528 RepID=A0A6M3LDE5_9ZZZZ